MEVELKYAVPDHETFEQLLSLTHLGEYWLQPAGEQRLTDHYLDTPERAVMTGGYALRLREGAEHGDWIGTLKGLGGAAGAGVDAAASALHEREEYESQVPPHAMPEAWPAGPARERALELGGSQPMLEMFVIAQERHKRLVQAGTDPAAQREVAELSLDVVNLPRNGRGQVIYELEIELRPDGTRDDLLVLREALTGYQLAPQSLSKFERALALVDQAAAHELAATDQPSDETPAAAAAEPAPDKKPARPKSPGVRADETMAQAGRKVLRFHFDRMLDKEDAVRQGADIEAVHDMRVATRRQRAALTLFADHIKRKPLRRFGGELKTLAHLLGGVRDLDVLLKSAREYQSKLPAPAAAALQPVLEAWSRERETARQALLAHLDSQAYRAFKKAYKKFLEAKGVEHPPAGALPQPNLVRQVVPGQLWDHFGEVRAYEGVVASADVPTLHTLRIASKSLRYALEFFREVLETGAGGGKRNGIGFPIEAVVALQDHIGELHDADVTITRLHAFLQGEGDGEVRLAPEAVMAVGHYLKTKQAQVRRLQRGAVRPWRVVSGAKFRRILGKAASGL